MNIYVGNLSHKVQEDDLQRAFEEFGYVKAIKLVRDRYSGKSRGFGFVEMPVDTEAQSAITGLNSTLLKNKMLNVNEARPPRNVEKRSYRRYI